jgi:hypothetical protein
MQDLNLAALSATCGATRQWQMRDVRHDRDASGDDQALLLSFLRSCYLFLPDSHHILELPDRNIIFANDIIQKPFSTPKT